MASRVTSFFMLIAFSGQLFFNFILQADYIVRYDAYLERCINKAKPSLKCNGQCQVYLKMQQAQAETSDEQAPVAVKQPEPLFHPTFFPLDELKLDVFQSSPLPPTEDMICIRSLDQVFRPPCIC